MFKQIFSGMFSTGEGIPISALEQTLTENNTILLDVREEDEFIKGKWRTPRYLLHASVKRLLAH